MSAMHARRCVASPTHRRPPRRGLTLVEIIVAIGIVGLLLALLVPAVQAAGEAARRTVCAGNLRQIGHALQLHHAAHNVFPPGVSSAERYPHRPWLSWAVRLLPYVEQRPLWEAAQADYQRQRNPFKPAPHAGLSLPLDLLACPADGRVQQTQTTHKALRVGLTSYVGVAGTDFQARDGLLFRDSRLTSADIKDGASQTLIVGERPPSSDFWYGWWYAGVGQRRSGVPDMLLGVRERNIGYQRLRRCPAGPYELAPGSPGEFCDVLHFWSLHPSGAHFALADGSARFISTAGAATLTALATRAGRDVP